MIIRRKASILVFQALYSWDIARQPLSELAAFSWETDGKLAAVGDEVLDSARLLLRIALENVEALDAAIADTLENWDFDRVSGADRAILRYGASLLLFQRDLDVAVVIKEGVDLAKEFSGLAASAFVHGILDAIAKKRLA
jgi:N utilization substance protein B